MTRRLMETVWTPLLTGPVWIGATYYLFRHRIAQTSQSAYLAYHGHMMQIFAMMHLFYAFYTGCVQSDSCQGNVIVTVGFM